MDWHLTILELIDLRSFSTLWYWIALAAIWARRVHYVLGVPYDMVGRAARLEGRAMEDLHHLVRIHVVRILHLAHGAGVWLVAGAAALLSALAVLGFGYGLEFAQAVFLVAFPLAGIGALSIRTAAAIDRRRVAGQELCRRLRMHRLVVQAIAMVSIFVTALWGMYRILSVGLMGG